MSKMYKPQNQIPRQFGGKRHTGGGESHSKPNRSQQKPNRGFLGLLPHYPAYLFTLGSLCIVFILLFLPWQTQQDRQDWTFRQSVKHDLDNYKGVIANLFPSPSTSTSTVTITTTTTVKPPVEATPLPSKEAVPEVKMSTTEQTFIAIKPDGVQRGLVGAIVSRFESRGFKLVAIKLVTPGKAHLEKHYEDLKEKSFFPGLIEYMNSGPICAMIWEGLDAVKTGRTLLGATNPLSSAPGTIRGDFALQTGRNVCHGSDSVENAKKEIALWFKEGEVVSWESAQAKWIYE